MLFFVTVVALAVVSGLVAAAFSPVAVKHYARVSLLAVAGSILVGYLAALPSLLHHGSTTNAASAPPEPTVAASAPSSAPAAASQNVAVQPSTNGESATTQAQASAPPQTAFAPASYPQTQQVRQPAPEPPRPRSPSRNGVSIVLDGLNETRDRYVATIRVVNENPSDVGVVLLSNQAFTADAQISDGTGGACQMISNGEGWGSLSAMIPGSMNLGSNFALVPANSEARHVLFFNKTRCATPMRSRTNIYLSMTFVVQMNGQAFTAPFTFSNLTMN